MAQLTIHVADVIWLVFINDRQSDFIAMLLHHTCTISLITFSYFTNFSSTGSLVILLHDFGDFFVYIARISTSTDIYSSLKLSSGLTLTGVFIYTRLYIFFFIIENHFIGFFNKSNNENFRDFSLLYLLTKYILGLQFYIYDSKGIIS